MNRILTDFYYGRISPWERRPIQSAEGREINRKIEDEKRYLIQKMSLDLPAVPSEGKSLFAIQRSRTVWDFFLWLQTGHGIDDSGIGR